MPNCMNCGKYSMLGLSLNKGLCPNCYDLLTSNLSKHFSAIDESKRIYDDSDHPDIKAKMLKNAIRHGQEISNIYLYSRLGDYSVALKFVHEMKGMLRHLQRELGKERIKDWNKKPQNRVSEILPIISPAAPITTIDMPYERVKGKLNKSRVIIIDGNDQITIEQLALRRFAEMGYGGFLGENRFWEVLGAFMFYEDILIEHEGRFCMPFPAKVKTMMYVDTYFKKLQFLKEDGALKERIQHNMNHYLSLPLLYEVEEKRRESERFRNTLAWSDIVVEHMDRCKLLRVIDWVITRSQGEIKGMPDLILFKENEIAFAEVKSERDRISMVQAETLEYLSSNLGIKVYLAEGKDISQ